MKNHHLALLASVVSLAACSSASGPTYNAYELQPRDGIRTFRVDCHGILSSEKTCMKVATRMCGSDAVRVVDSAAPFREGADPQLRPLQVDQDADRPAVAHLSFARMVDHSVPLIGDRGYFGLS